MAVLAATEAQRGAYRPSERLASLFTGEHAWCAEKLMLSANLEGAMSLNSFFTGGASEQAIDGYAAISGGTDRRAAVSMWTLYYFAGLTIAYLIAKRAGGRRLPVAFDEMTIALNEDGLPRAFGVPHSGWDDGAARGSFEAIDPLLETHLFKAVGQLVKHGISAKLCWNNAAVYIDYALRLTADKDDPDLAQADLPVFVRGCLPDGGVNPLSGCIRHVEENGECVARRKVCCLRYMLPGIPSCGKLCALPERRNQ